MSHTGVDIIDHLLYAVYPVLGIFAVEGISRLIRAPKWTKLWAQAAVSIGFGVYFWFVLPVPDNFPMAAVVLFMLAVALIYQGRRARISPDKTPY